MAMICAFSLLISATLSSLVLVADSALQCDKSSRVAWHTHIAPRQACTRACTHTRTHTHTHNTNCYIACLWFEPYNPIPHHSHFNSFNRVLIILFKKLIKQGCTLLQGLLCILQLLLLSLLGKEAHRCKLWTAAASASTFVLTHTTQTSKHQMLSEILYPACTGA